MRIRFALAAVALTCLMLALPKFAAASTYITFNVPGFVHGGSSDWDQQVGLGYGLLHHMLGQLPHRFPLPV